MNSDRSLLAERFPNEPRFPLMERITATALVVFIVALGWMVLVAYKPEWARLPSLEVEVLIVLTLLLAALLLVSVVALLHTRS